MLKGFAKIGLPKDSFAAYFSRCMKLQSLELDEYILRNIGKGETNIRLYPSSLPACSIETTLRALSYKVAVHMFQRGELPHAPSNPMSETYAGMGTLRHAVSQKYLGLGGRMIGNWKCRAAKCKGTRKFSSNHQCPICKKAMEYEEIALQIWIGKKGSKYKALSAKFDGVFEDTDGKLWIIDYKFKTSNGLRPWSKKKLPQPEHLTQVDVYVAMLRNILKTSRLKQVAGHILLYAAFDELNLSPNGLYHVVRTPVSEKRSDRVWQHLHSTEIPKVVLANEDADKILRHYIKKRELSFKWFERTMLAHDCTGEKCCVAEFQNRPKKMRLNVLEAANQLLEVLE